LLSFSDGSFAMFAPAIAPTPQAITTSMPIPSGGAVALKAGGSAAARPLALGGAAFPFLYEIDPFSGVITLRSAALPGNPIDFAIGIDRTAHVVAFGSACGPAAVQALPTNPPTLGSTLVLSAAGQPNAILLLVLGLDDIAGNTLPTPLPFAGGCLLHITPDLLLAFATSPSGQASHAIPLPSGPQFVAMPLFAQWAQLDVAGFSLGEANAYFLGNGSTRFTGARAALWRARPRPRPIRRAALPRRPPRPWAAFRRAGASRSRRRRAPPRSRRDAAG
jgi:hypothetical protein